ncbi:hypothetical protein RCCGE510_25486 (plasmid) [Rhizobium sp. CCGE 510]|nr:hypothetical protein RCCGE510_25486 [Rhizobium sp. CCGE 510]
MLADYHSMSMILPAVGQAFRHPGDFCFGIGPGLICRVSDESRDPEAEFQWRDVQPHKLLHPDIALLVALVVAIGCKFVMSGDDIDSHASAAQAGGLPVAGTDGDQGLEGRRSRHRPLPGR